MRRLPNLPLFELTIIQWIPGLAVTLKRLPQTGLMPG